MPSKLTSLRFLSFEKRNPTFSDPGECDKGLRPLKVTAGRNLSGLLVFHFTDDESMSKMVKTFIKSPQADFGVTFVMYSYAFLYFNPKTLGTQITYYPPPLPTKALRLVGGTDNRTQSFWMTTFSI